MIQIYVMTYTNCTNSSSNHLTFGDRGYRCSKATGIFILDCSIRSLSDQLKCDLNTFLGGDTVSINYKPRYIVVPNSAGENVKDWLKSFFKKNRKRFNEVLESNKDAVISNMPKIRGGDNAVSLNEASQTTSEIIKFEEIDMSLIMQELLDTLNAVAQDDNGVDGCFVYTPQQTEMSVVTGGSGASFTSDNISNWVGIFTGKLFLDKYQFINDGIGKLCKVIFCSEKSYVFLYFVRDDVIVGFLSSHEQLDDFARANKHSEKALLGDKKDGVSKYLLPKAKTEVRCLQQILSDAGFI